jgi:hypothetical protein
MRLSGAALNTYGGQMNKLTVVAAGVLLIAVAAGLWAARDQINRVIWPAMETVCVAIPDRGLHDLGNAERCYRVHRWKAQRLAELSCPDGRLEWIEDSDPLRVPRCYTVARR